MIINGQELLRRAPIIGMCISKQVMAGTSYGLSEAGYDIRLKQDVLFARPDPTMDFHHKVGNDVPAYGHFALASAIEEFNMPTNLVGIVHDKSSWARRGLSVFNTVIEPGWKGFLTLELVYHGNGPLLISAGSGIAQVIFHNTIEHASYNGKYQYQADEPVPAIY